MAAYKGASSGSQFYGFNGLLLMSIFRCFPLGPSTDSRASGSRHLAVVMHARVSSLGISIGILVEHLSSRFQTKVDTARPRCRGSVPKVCQYLEYSSPTNTKSVARNSSTFDEHIN